MSYTIPQDLIIYFKEKMLDKNNHLNKLWKKRKDNSIILNFLSKNNISIFQLGYMIMNNTNDIPKCKHCGKELLLDSLNCIKKYCSVNCSSKDENRIENIKKTNIEKYGVVSILSLNNIKEKIKKTNIEKYGYDNPIKNEKIKNKSKNTILKKYGVECVLQSKEIKEKIKKTNNEKYGHDYALQCDEIKNKLSQTKKIELRKNNLEHFLIGCEKSNIQCLNIDNFLKGENPIYKCLVCNNTFESSHIYSFKVVCPECSKNNYSSGEKELIDLLLKLGIKEDEIVQHDRKTLSNNKELDIFIPSKNLAIEFNGKYWHSVNFKGKNYHYEKSIECRNKGIRLFQIYEFLWKNTNKRNILISMIKSALGLIKNKIYARNCSFANISSNSYKIFLDSNHIQGNVISKYTFGLYYDNKLVAVMGFGKSRFKKDEFELHRFCSLCDYEIVGGFSKLLKNSIKEIKKENSISELTSYIDLDYYNGSGYSKNNFIELGTAPPSYWWIKNDEVLYRISTQKHKLKKLLKENYYENKSERENMELNGYLQIYNSGNLKVKLKI